MIGKIISHYRVQDLIATGGMAEVYKAQDTKLPRCVALKFLRSEKAEPEERQRFIQEAQAASALDHPNICTIFEIGETEAGRMFIAMPCYEGGSLKDRISRSPLPLAEAIDVALQIAQGLSKAHERGIIHRDLKPVNVMLTSDGIVKIVDFGLAKLTDCERLTRTGETLGTPAYMSPEQASNIDVDERTDIWSMGVILYEMLSAQLPFQGEKYPSLLYAIINDEPKSLRGLAPNLPDRILSLIDRALKKNRDERYQTVNDMLLELRGLGQELEAQAASGAVTLPFGAHPTVVVKKLRRLIEDSLVISETPRPPSPENPFLNRVRIQNPRDFYGRSSELSRIYERIKAGRPQSVSVVGVRRIGKSSLLSAILHPANRKKHLPAAQEFVFVFMDFQEKRNVESGELLQYILNALRKEFRDQLKLNCRPDYEGLKEVVQAFQEASLNLIFLWDEFESVTKNPKIGPEFYAYFRALANNFNVAYITTSSAQLQSLCHTKEIADSPFFNIFSNQGLGPFKLEEARQLICEPSARAGKPLVDHAEFVLEIAGCFPFFIQIACSALFSVDLGEKAAYEKAKTIFMEEAEPHFREIWERLSESQRIVAAALARKRTPPREHAFALKELTQAGFVSEGKLFSSLFAEFIRGLNPPASWWKLW